MTRQRIVIIGAGFGGLAATRAFAGAAVDVTLIDRRNHHLFQPLLYQVATAGLSPADIAAPIRAIVRDQANVRVLLGTVTGVDRIRRTVKLAQGGEIPYDRLIVASGARHSYFGRDDWAQHAPGLKSISDATAVRHRVLLALERAETEEDETRRQALLTFVVIGGGPTGVEMAGAIAELARRSVSKDFRSITPHCSRVYLIEGGPRLLAGFPEDLSSKARGAIEQLGVTVMTGHRVEGVAEDHVLVGGECLPAHTIVWAAGVQASPAAKWLGTSSDRAGRVEVNDDLTILGDDRVFVIGDTAAVSNLQGGTLPGIAPVAKQQGRHVARQILSGRSEPFRYRNWGNLATIGRHRAVIDMGRLRLSGPLAWLLWCTAHIFFLVGFRNRFIVGASWLWNYFTFQRGARLITSDALTIQQGDRI
ncbi:NAD(P)/FAD-dependent oxidoreductase [Erythrobacter mangrovi]|uniref:NADH:ubiquinone reductase (non-electrogenic) n=1 Tax=Erythrobacter mangrovi TaxID=2739433 RepID=A0A7D3XJ02_9SPHN|nr:NAD(P)/FAD-dependent oxidoreductase [Erythrobacter mangrovi]QKG72573.1 NAD(P)/FAD-dependent oxidoreductase [Erythrobacter mangrovi]